MELKQTGPAVFVFWTSSKNLSSLVALICETVFLDDPLTIPCVHGAVRHEQIFISSNVKGNMSLIKHTPSRFTCPSHFTTCPLNYIPFPLPIPLPLKLSDSYHEKGL